MNFKVGDVVVITQRLNGHLFEIGEKVEIIKIDGDNCYKAKPLHGCEDYDVCWWVGEAEIRKISKQIDLNDVSRILYKTIQMLEHNNKTLQSFENYEQFEKFVMKNKSNFIGFNKNKSGFAETLQFIWSLR